MLLGEILLALLILVDILLRQASLKKNHRRDILIEANLSSIMESLVDNRGENPSSPIPYIEKDRNALLLLMAHSFHQANLLTVEKRHPQSKTVRLVFPYKEATLRFSILEELVPKAMLTDPIVINPEAVDASFNYWQIDKLLLL
jgi:hypothetical protein